MKVNRLTVGLFCSFLASCGSNAATSGGSPVDTPGEATQAASGTALQTTTDSVSGAAGGGIGNANQSVSRMLIRGMVRDLTVPVEESFSEDFDCASGSGSMSGSISGTIEGDIVDDAFVFSALDMDMTMAGQMTACAPADNPETDFDESSIELDGEFDGSASVALDADMLDMTMAMSAVIEFDETVCEGGGELEMEFTGSGTSTIPEQEGEEPDFDCEVSGTLTGTACGQAVSCTISGDCDNPTQSGTGC